MNVITTIIHPFTFLLRPFTYFIPLPVEKILIFWLGNDECYDVIFRKVNFKLNPSCLTLFICQLFISFLVLLSSSMKLPQIFNILYSKSTQSISTTAYIVESISDVIFTSFSYRSGYFISSYLESSLITIQNVIITTLLLVYDGNPTFSAAFVCSISVFTSVIINPNSSIIDHWSLLEIQRLTFPLPLVSKLIQIYTLWRSKTSGQLCGISLIYYSVTSFGRLFTSGVDDRFIFGVTFVGFILDLALVYLYNQYLKEEDYSYTERLPNWYRNKFTKEYRLIN